MPGINHLFAYIGPETIVPATSVIAAVVGFLLAFGKTALRPVVAVFWRLTGRKPAEPEAVSAAESASSPPEVAQN